MRNKGWSAIALAMVLPVIFFRASCAKKVVQTRAETQTQTQAQPQPAATTQPEVQKAPDRPAAEAKPDGRLEEARLRAESAARLAALTAFVAENIHFAF